MEAKPRDKIGEIARLVHDYPGSKAEEWRKVKAVSLIRDRYGEEYKAEIHWCEEKNVGKKEFKYKGEIDEG